MSDVTQIRIGKHMTGIIGFKSAMVEAAGRCKGMSDDQIGSVLVEILSKSNYIEARIEAEYTQAFLREYKRHIGEPVAAVAGQGILIKVLGRGCPQCDRLEREVMSVMAETGIVADLEHVRDLAEIGRYGVLGSPALVIDGKVKMVGSVPPASKIKVWLEEAAKQTKS
jgi:small redox-active disulfide protein 2